MVYEIKNLQKLINEFKKTFGYDDRQDIKIYTELTIDKPNKQNFSGELRVNISKIKEMEHIKFEDVETLYIVDSLFKYLINYLYQFNHLTNITIEPISLEIDENFTHFIIYSPIVFYFEMKEVSITQELIETLKTINIMNLNKKLYNLYDTYENNFISNKAISLSLNLNLIDLKQSVITIDLIFKSEKDIAQQVLDEFWNILDKYGNSVIYIDSQVNIVHQPIQISETSEDIDDYEEQSTEFNFKNLKFDNIITFTINLLDFLYC